MQDKTQRRPIIDPLLLMLKSRRVMVALISILVGLLVNAVPELESVQNELTVLIATLALALIGGYSVEDAAHAAKTEPRPSPDDVREALEKAARDILQETSPQKAGLPPD